MNSEEPCGAEVLARLRLKEFHSGIVCFFNVEVVDEVGYESSEELEFLVRGSLLLCVFKGVEG